MARTCLSESNLILKILKIKFKSREPRRLNQFAVGLGLFWKMSFLHLSKGNFLFRIPPFQLILSFRLGIHHVYEGVIQWNDIGEVGRKFVLSHGYGTYRKDRGRRSEKHAPHLISTCDHFLEDFCQPRDAQADADRQDPGAEPLPLHRDPPQPLVAESVDKDLTILLLGTVLLTSDFQREETESNCLISISRCDTQWWQFQ